MRNILLKLNRTRFCGFSRTTRSHFFVVFIFFPFCLALSIKLGDIHTVLRVLLILCASALPPFSIYVRDSYNGTHCTLSWLRRPAVVRRRYIHMTPKYVLPHWFSKSFHFVHNSSNSLVVSVGQMFSNCNVLYSNQGCEKGYWHLNNCSSSIFFAKYIWLQRMRMRLNSCYQEPIHVLPKIFENYLIKLIYSIEGN